MTFALPDDVNVEVAQFLLSFVPFTVVFQRQVGEEEIHWCEPTVQVVEEFSESFVEACTNLFALQGP